MKCKIFSAVVACLLSAILSASPDPMISITPVTRSMAQEGGTGAINTSGSGTWTASVSADWIMIVGGTSGSAGYAVGYTVSANNNVEARTGHVYVSGHVHTITQSGIGAELENDTASFESAGGSGQVTVIAQPGKSWTARSNVNWITLNKTGGVGTSSLSYTVAPYQEVSTRVGTLIVAGETFTVSQTGCRMQLSSYEVTSDYLAESFKVRVNALATTEWQVATTASWVTIDDAGNGIGADSIKFSISENESYSPRTATVQIGTERFTVTQLGRTSLVFRLSEKEALYGVDGVAEARIAVSATPDLGWQAQSDCDWIEIYSSYVTGSGDGTIVYKVKANPTLYARSGTITVRAEDDAVSQKRIDVSQAAAEATLTMDGFEFEAGGEEARVGVNTGAIVGWNVINTNNWLSVSGVPAAGSAVLTLVASPNPTVEERSGVLMIADRPFTVSQKGRGVSVDYTARVFNTDGKTTGMDAENVIRVTAESDVSWTAEASDATWIVIYEGKSGQGNGIIKYIVAPYLGSGEMRTGTIRVGDQTVYITQRPYALSIEPNGAIMDANAGAGEIQVALDIEGVWNAIATEPWITVKSGYDAGTGSGRVIFTYTDNNTGKERTGKIIIAGEEYTLTQAARQNIAITTSVEGTGGFVEGGGVYNIGTELQLKAVAESGYQFVSWSLPDGATSNQAIINIVATANATYTARFSAIAPVLSVVSTSLQGVKLSWQNIAWAVDYNIWRNSTSSKASAVKIATLKSDGLGEYLDAMGTENQVYWYWVEAVGASDSKWSNGIQAKREKQTFAIVYKNLRGASHSNPATYLEGNRIQFTPPTSRRGYTFIGWNPSEVDSTVSGDVSVRAIWAQNEYSVHFDPNGGTGDMPDQNFMYGYWRYLSDANVLRPGCEFAGWSTTESGDAIYFDRESLKNLTSEMNGVVTLYAKWTNLHDFVINEDGVLTEVILGNDTSLVIPDGVTSIGDYAFNCCDSLTSVTIPDSVTSIGDWAFSDCSSLASVTIPDSVTSIGAGAFKGCEGLADDNGFVIVKGVLYDYYGEGGVVVIPDGVTRIGDDAFFGCDSLTSVIIPDSVTSIGAGAFKGCEGLADDNGFVIVKGVLYDYYGEGGVVVIPDGVTSIGDYAFEDCDSLTSVTILDSVTSIGDSAFRDCNSLTRVSISQSLRDQVESGGVFDRCPKLQIVWREVVDWRYTISNGEVTITGISQEPSGEIIIPSRIDGYPVTRIGDWAFSDCSSLTSVTIPDSVTSIGDFAFYGCSSLTSVTIPEGVTSIGDYAFSDCDSLTSVTIPDSVTSIGEGAFSDCSSLTSVTIPDSVTSIGECAFGYCSSLTSITIPDSVTSIGDWAFGYCSSLTSVTIPDSVTNIGDFVFFWCESLTSVTVPKNITSIGHCVFACCEQLVNEEGLFIIGDVLYYCNLQGDITIPDSVTSIGSGAFCYGYEDMDCYDDSITSITIPNSVTNIESLAFVNCRALTSVAIPISVANIDDKAFYNCRNLKRVELPETLRSQIEEGFVFRACPSDLEIIYMVIPNVTDDSKVSAALGDFPDVKLAANIKTAAEYAAFREWALNLEGVTPEEVKASPNAWLSYALNTDKLIIAAPKEGDIVIDTFESAANDGVFEFTVKIDGIAVGDNALEANLKKVFGIEGAETLASGGAGFSSDSVEVNTAMPENGNAKFTVTPKVGNGQSPNSFFFRVKMK